MTSIHPSLEQIYDSLMAALGEQTLESSQNLEQQKDLSHLHLLIAEDNPINQQVITSMLDRNKIKMTTANNGQEALDYFQANHQNIDGVFMDCEMPEMDGYTATERIRSFENLRNLSSTPIIAITAHAVEEYQQRCFESGMNDIITKPVNAKEIQKKLSQWFKEA
jgi:CheY-like chemotaxis protein